MKQVVHKISAGFITWQNSSASSLLSLGVFFKACWSTVKIVYIYTYNNWAKVWIVPLFQYWRDRDKQLILVEAITG